MGYRELFGDDEFGASPIFPGFDAIHLQGGSGDAPVGSWGAFGALGSYADFGAAPVIVDDFGNVSNADELFGAGFTMPQIQAGLRRAIAARAAQQRRPAPHPAQHHPLAHPNFGRGLQQMVKEQIKQHTEQPDDGVVQLALSSDAVIAAGGTGIVTNSPGRDVIPLRLLTSESNPFAVSDLKAGDYPLFTGTGYGPAAAYAPNSQVGYLKRRVLTATMRMSMLVRNDSASPAFFTSFVMCQAVKRGETC